MAYNVTGLSNYVEVNKDALVKAVVLGANYGDTIPNLRKQLNIKTKERLNYLDVTPIFQDGTGCGWQASGATNFSEREIETALIKVNSEWCAQDLLGKFAEYMVNVGVNEGAMPFEQQITNEIVRKSVEEQERLVWNGDKSGGDLIDGFLTQALGADSASTVNVSIAAGTAVYNAVKSVIFAIPDELMDKTTVFVSPAVYRHLVDELIEKNMYHFVPSENQEGKDFIFPGTSVKVHKTFGLAGDKRHIYASPYENMVYGADLMNEREEFKMWFDDKDEMHRLKMRFNMGVKTLYPDAVILGTAAADLV